MAQSSKDAPKANTTKATNSTTVNEPRKNPTNFKISNPMSSVENPNKTSANPQNIPEKTIKDSRN